MASVLDHALVAQADREALADPRRRLTYRQLDRAVGAAARLFVGLGVSAGARVAACLPNGCDIVIAFLATQRLGAVWVGVNAVLSPGEKRHILDHSGAKVLVTDNRGSSVFDDLLGDLPELDRILVIDDAQRDGGWAGVFAETEAAPPPRPQIDPFAPAAIMYTSGTTGAPKGVVHSQHNMVTVIAAASDAGIMHPHGVRGVVLSLTITNVMIQGPLYAFWNGRSCICGQSAKPDQLIDWAARERIDTVAVVPTIIYDLLQADRDLPPGLVIGRGRRPDADAAARGLQGPLRPDGSADARRARRGRAQWVQLPGVAPPSHHHPRRRRPSPAGRRGRGDLRVGGDRGAVGQCLRARARLLEGRREDHDEVGKEQHENPCPAGAQDERRRGLGSRRGAWYLGPARSNAMPPSADPLATARRLLDLRRGADAEALLRAACAEGLGDDPEVRTALAFALLQQGRYPEGFAAFEHREGRRTAKVRQLPTPEWDGSPLAGRTILIWTEQGIGDEIMLARFIPRLRAAGAARIFLGCLPSNVRAFGQLGLDGVFPRFRAEGGRIAIPAHHCWTLLFSLPHRLGVTREGLSGAPYLEAEPRRRGGVGIVERGNPENPRDAVRSIPDGLLRRALPEAELLAPEGDLQDSLERVAGLDLLVTVDTSWAHMAGALGVPCWLLLPAERADWRWLPRAERTPWYDSLRLFWQQSPGDWSGPIGEVVARLESNRRAGAAVGA